MATFTVGDTAFADFLVFAPPSTGVINWAQQQASTFASTMGNMASSFFAGMSNYFAPVDYNQIAMKLAQTARVEDSLWTLNIIQPLTTVADFQQAPTIMIPWIMADPLLGRMYESNLCEGYGEEYKPLNGHTTGFFNPYYRAATDGAWIEVDDGQALQQTKHMEDFTGTEYQIDFAQQAAILQTWYNRREHGKAFKSDVTSRSGVTY